VQFNVPYVVFGSFTSFYNSHEIKDCLCFLRWLRNGRDRIAMLRAIETPKRGLGDSAIREFDNYCALVEAFWEEHYSEIPRPSALDILFLLSGNYSNRVVESSLFPPADASFSTRPLKLFVEFSRQITLLREVASYSTVSKTLQFLVDAFDLKPYFNKISQSKNDCEERLANVDELIKAAMRYNGDGACLPLQKTEPVSSDETDNQSSLGSFLDDVSMVTEIADSKADEPGGERFVASLMTIHASKGMEFDSVYFVGVEDKTIPSAQVSRERASNRHFCCSSHQNVFYSFTMLYKKSLELGEGSIPFEEEKRLCYVAMTRAKSELIMTWRQRATIFTADGLKTVDRFRSRFLDALVSKKANGSSTKKSSVSMRPSTSISVMDKAQQIKALAKQSSKRLYGTSSAYGKEAQMPSPRNGKDVRPSAFNQAPRRPQSPKASQSFLTAAVGKMPLPPHREPNPKSSSKAIDASWFFPIGSKVRHKHLGEGIVLQSNVSDADSCDAVLVEFQTGEQREFPVQTTDLSPVLL
jgi:ATP-dependent exoDNAse (exonuclease V) beta subunit